MDKKSLRKFYREKRQALTTLQQKEKSQKIAAHLEAIPFWQEAKTIAAYLAIHNEVDLSPLFTKSWAAEKQLAIPYCLEMGKMEMLRFSKETPLFLNANQIPEPEWIPEQVISPQDLDLVLIPALAIDASGIRLGYGGGFYDRYLAKIPNVLKIGITYDFSFTNEWLPKNEFDLPVDYVVTEKGIFSTKKRITEK